MNKHLKQGGLLRLQHVLALVFAFVVTVLIVVNRSRIETLTTYGYLSIFLLCFLANATVLFPAPSLTVVFVFGSVYVPFWVGLVGAIGTTCGELIGYVAGYGGRPFIEQTPWHSKLRMALEQHSFFVIFLLALAPVPFFDLVGIAAGSLNISVFKFLVPCFAGKLIKMVFYAYLGAGVIPWLEPIIRQQLDRQ